jgi:hypothetical protein
MNRTALACTAMACLTAAGTTLLVAGPLNPPTGAVAPTYKTLADVEPRTAVTLATTPGDADSQFKITVPGSYYLTASILSSGGKHGIEIASSGVTLDLNGFSLTGLQSSKSAVVVTGAFLNVTIRNGALSSWDLDAISAPTASGVTIEDVNVIAGFATGAGIRVGDRATISRCSARATISHGFQGGNDCLISDCRSIQSISGSGFDFASGCTFTRCTANDNALDGIHAVNEARVESCSTTDNSRAGISVGSQASIDGCISASNGSHGISATQNATIADCTTEANTGCGLIVNTYASVRSVLASFNGSDGIIFSVGSVSNCSAIFNSGDGIRCAGGLVTASYASANDQDGIDAGGGQVANCYVEASALNGIRVTAGSAVENCRSERNTLAGIQVDPGLNGGARIDSNTVADNGTGIRTDVAGCIVIRNVFRANDTTSFYAAGTTAGTMLFFPTGGTLSSSNAWANISN